MSDQAQTLLVSTWGLQAIGEAVDGELEVSGSREVTSPPAGVSTDTRTIEPGELFIALRGPRFDAHDFLDEAFESGAPAAVVERDALPAAEAMPRDAAFIYVDDTTRALQKLGTALWREARDDGLHTVNVTGSNGKTTTKELLDTVWSTRGRVHATPGNLNNAIGVPLTLCALPVGCEHLIVEMGANAPGEIAELVRMAPGDERIITSIGYDHTEGFGSLDGVRRAKAEIAQGAGAGNTVIIPESEGDTLGVGEITEARVVTFGPEPAADLRVVDYRPDADRGFEVTLEGLGRRATFAMRLPGRHNARNLAGAVATAWTRDVSLDEQALSRQLMNLQLPAGRWREVECGSLRFVDDAYNANPSSVPAAVDAFLDWSRGRGRRRVVVLGDMLELGERAEQFHEAVAGDVAGRSELAGVCAVGKFGSVMARSARRDGREGLEVAGVDDVEAAADWLAGFGPADVLLKGSRGSALEQIIDLIDERRERETG